MNVDRLPKLQEQDPTKKTKEHPCKRIAIEAYMCKGQNHIAYTFGICNELFDKVKECLAEDERNNPPPVETTSTRRSRQ